MGLYYRYRPMSELSIKELMYDEMFFASTEESNDPYEGKVFFKFEKSHEKWERLLRAAWKNEESSTIEQYIEPFSTYLTNQSPLTFDEVQVLDFNELKFNTEVGLFILKTMYLEDVLKRFLAIYKPDRKYFVSFSKTPDNYLMWSHYANKHNGYCLVFKSIDGGIYQSYNNKRTSISRYTPNSFSPHMSYAIPEKFELIDVFYNSKELDVDAFLCFPPYVSGYKFKNESERIELYNKLRKPFLEKNSCWAYEEETRLLLNSPTAWLFGDNIECSKHERLMHYDFSQLVGIILGYKMSMDDRNRIKEIIHGKIENRHNTDANREVYRYFDFVLFETQLAQQQRNVEIIPKEIYGDTKVLTTADENFEKRYNEWKQGYGIEFQGNRSSRIRID